MINIKIKILLLVTCSMFVSCVPNGIAVKKHTGFHELPFASNNYSTGQIVELYTKPNKVDITYTPKFESTNRLGMNTLLKSPGWNIKSSNTDNVKAEIEADIKNVATAEGSYSSDTEIEISFTDTETQTISKRDIYGVISQDIYDDTMLKDLILKYKSHKNRIKFSVVTSVLKAKVSFRLKNSSGQTINVSSADLSKINAKLNLNFSRQASSDIFITGDKLVVGIHTDPIMMDVILADVE